MTVIFPLESLHAQLRSVLAWTPCLCQNETKPMTELSVFRLVFQTYSLFISLILTNIYSERSELAKGHAGRGRTCGKNLHSSDLALWESDCDGSHGQFEISRLKSVTSAEVEWSRFGTGSLFTISGLHYWGSNPELKVAVKVSFGRGSLNILIEF